MAFTGDIDELRAEFDRVVAEMEWDEVISTLEDVITHILADKAGPSAPTPAPTPTPGPAPTPAPPPPPPAGAGFAAFPQQFSFQQPGGIMASPGVHTVHAVHGLPLNPQQYQVEPLNQYGQMGVFIYDQVISPINPHMMMLPMGMNLQPVSFPNGNMVYNIAPASNPAPPAAASCNVGKKTKKRNQQDNKRPYIKRPPNAFMLYLKEQRQNVVSELNIRNNASVNEVLGRRWLALTEDEKAKYYQMAHEERRRHAQLHPDWSARENYGRAKAAKRERKGHSYVSAADNPRGIVQQRGFLPVELAASTDAMLSAARPPPPPEAAVSSASSDSSLGLDVELQQILQKLEPLQSSPMPAQPFGSLQLSVFA